MRVTGVTRVMAFPTLHMAYAPRQRARERMRISGEPLTLVTPSTPRRRGLDSIANDESRP